MADAEKQIKDAKEATRVRARKACKLCNSRRVRCNVMEKQPCNNCELAAVPCELMASRRGKYIRRPGIHGTGSGTKRRNTMDSSAPHPTHHVSVGQGHSPIEHQNYDFTHRRASESMTGPSPLSATTSRSMTAIQTATPDSDNTVFLGESNLLTCVAGNSTNSDPRSPSAAAPTPSGGDHQKPALCYPISQEISARASRIAAGATSKAAVIDFITSQGAYTFPVPSVCDTILHSYFAWFHPCFPIVDRAETSISYAANTLSPLLFQALLFVGSSYCPNGVIQEMGFKDRHVAKAHFYQRAKLLYDAERENNKTVVVQALFLMSFWRAGPLNEKDTRHWLGAAISLAQTRGFHRYTRSATIEPKHMKLRRKIWWSLYVRDRQCNASLGLPSHIRDDDCDVPMLEHADFTNEGTCLMPEIFGSTMPEHEAYAIHMAGLAILLGKIVNTEFAPSPSRSIDAQRSSLKNQLLSWKAGLPLEMCSTSADEPASFWSNMLLLAYKLAEQRAQVCILGLRELQKSWDVNNWVLQLFFSFLDERTANKLHVSDFQVKSSLSSATSTTASSANQSQAHSQAGHDRDRDQQGELITPAPSENHSHMDDALAADRRILAAGSEPGEDDIAMKMSGAMGEAYHTPLAMQALPPHPHPQHAPPPPQMPFYNIPPEAFNLDFYVDDEDFGQYFGLGGLAGQAGGPREGGEAEGWDSRGLDFLSRCL